MKKDMESQRESKMARKTGRAMGQGRWAERRDGERNRKGMGRREGECGEGDGSGMELPGHKPAPRLRASLQAVASPSMVHLQHKGICFIIPLRFP